MQVDKEKLEKLMNLSDDELKKKITGAINAANFDKLDKKNKENLEKALNNLNNMKDIKKTLGNIDEESLKNAVNALGVDKDAIEKMRKNFKGS